MALSNEWLEKVRDAFSLPSNVDVASLIETVEEHPNKTVVTLKDGSSIGFLIPPTGDSGQSSSQSTGGIVRGT